jgi:hypothetical protein
VFRLGDYHPQSDFTSFCTEDLLRKSGKIGLVFPRLGEAKLIEPQAAVHFPNGKPLAATTTAARRDRARSNRKCPRQSFSVRSRVRVVVPSRERAQLRSCPVQAIRRVQSAE